MPRVKLILRAALGAAAFLLYVWFAAVENVGRVKRRKARRRAARRG